MNRAATATLLTGVLALVVLCGCNGVSAPAGSRLKDFNNGSSGNSSQSYYFNGSGNGSGNGSIISLPPAGTTLPVLDKTLQAQANIADNADLNIQMLSGSAITNMELCFGAFTACINGQGQYSDPSNNFGSQGFEFDEVQVNPGQELTALESQNGSQLSGYRTFLFTSGNGGNVNSQPDDSAANTYAAPGISSTPSFTNNSTPSTAAPAGSGVITEDKSSASVSVNVSP